MTESKNTNQEKEYVLGTHDDEIDRLGLQHNVWRPRALDAWRRAGFTTGQTILDVGCGPGYASLDLANIVGHSGKIIAVDRSARFLRSLENSCRQRGISNLSTVEVDLNDAEMPSMSVDGAWARWVFAFVKNPRHLLEGLARSLRTGGIFVIHEYFDYSTWKLMPDSPELDEFVQMVMRSWREDGGEPDIARSLPGWLRELGFEVKSLNPIIDVVPPSNFVWQWPMAFVQVGIRRLVDLGYFSAQHGDEISEAIAARKSDPNSLMVTPAVLEIIAVRR
jgi:ubiquinone/menaquinone biosynthesis C-methylase UbiE